MFSGFFSNPLDQRENNLSWLVISALSLLQLPESWSKGQHRTGAVPNTGCQVASQGFTALAYPQPPAVPLACSRDA